MNRGHRGEAIRDLQRRLGAAGFLTDLGEEAGRFASSTEQALCNFQRERGLVVSGRCDEDTWASLVESSWIFGSRPLLLTAPHLRGDDVGELQARLARLGFDAGRVDGIYGPRTAGAVRAFQADSGLVVDGVCGTATAQAIRRVASQSGDGPGVAVLRERERRRKLRLIADCRLAVGQFGGLSTVGREVTRQLRAYGGRTITLDEPDAVTQAGAANTFNADVYLGFEACLGDQRLIQFYSVPSFESVEGRSLANHIAGRFGGTRGSAAQLAGVRRPILRETRMPAVLCAIGPVRMVADSATSIAATMARAVADWLAGDC